MVKSAKLQCMSHVPMNTDNDMCRLLSLVYGQSVVLCVRVKVHSRFRGGLTSIQLDAHTVVAGAVDTTQPTCDRTE
jgi:hypothetical protein